MFEFMELTISGLAFGALSGFLLGVLVSMFSRDGIYPEVWALFCTAGGLVGGVVGVLEFLRVVFLT